MMNSMTRVTIALPPRPYDAVIENGLLQRSGKTLQDLFQRIYTATPGDSPPRSINACSSSPSRPSAASGERS